MSEFLFALLIAAIIIAGIIGTILPIIPGLLLSWIGVLLYGIERGFGTVGLIVMAICTVLLVVGTYLGFRIPQKDAATTGLTTGAQLFALALGIIGAFVIPVVGLPLGFVLGVFLARQKATADVNAAWESTKLILRSMLKASLVQAICGAGMLVAWLGWVVYRSVTA